MRRLSLALAVAAACTRSPQPAPSRQSEIERSNQNAQLLLDVTARFFPEQAARFGLAGTDDRVTDYLPGHRERLRAAYRQALAELQSRQKSEEDALVAQDLQILVASAQRQIRGSELSERLEVPYTFLARNIFSSIRALLDPQIAKERHPAALVRVRKYAGLEPGIPPVAQALEAEIREGLAKGLLPPSRIEVESELHTSKFLIDGIEKLFQEFAVPGWEQPVAALKGQLEQHVTFLSAEVLPKARDDFRLPAELYAFDLEQVGVDIPAQELMQRAHAGFSEIQGEMQTVAARIAQSRHL